MYFPAVSMNALGEKLMIAGHPFMKIRINFRISSKTGILKYPVSFFFKLETLEKLEKKNIFLIENWRHWTFGEFSWYVFFWPPEYTYFSVRSQIYAFQILEKTAFEFTNTNKNKKNVQLHFFKCSENESLRFVNHHTRKSLFTLFYNAYKYLHHKTDCDCSFSLSKVKRYTHHASLKHFVFSWNLAE